MLCLSDSVHIKREKNHKSTTITTSNINTNTGGGGGSGGDTVIYTAQIQLCYKSICTIQGTD